MGIQELRQFLKKHNIQSSINSHAELLELMQKESLTALVDTGNWYSIIKRCHGQIESIFRQFNPLLHQDFIYFLDHPETVSIQKNDTQTKRRMIKEQGYLQCNELLNEIKNSKKNNKRIFKKFKKLYSKNYPITIDCINDFNRNLFLKG